MITDDEKQRLIKAIVERVDDRSAFHGYPAERSWMWGIIEKAVDLTLMAERDQRSVVDVIEAQNILDVLGGDSKSTLAMGKQPKWAALGGGATPIAYSGGGVGGAGGPATCGPFAPTYALPPLPALPAVSAPRGALVKKPEREPDHPSASYSHRVDVHKHHSPNWLNGPSNKNGIPFYEAPKPRKRHRCWAQTFGTNTHVIHMEFCPCGGWRMDGLGAWNDRNSRPESK